MRWNRKGGGGERGGRWGEQSELGFYSQPTTTVISERERERENMKT